MTARDEIDMDRVEALRYPCTYQLPGSRRSDPKVCGAGVGEPCVYPGTDRPLRNFPAHLPRLRAAGVASDSTVPRPPESTSSG